MTQLKSREYMTDMWRRIVCSGFFVFLLVTSFAQKEDGYFKNPFKKDLLVIKTGPYFGLQQGKYLVPELGVERQWQQIKLKDPVTHAAHMGFSYNFKYKVLGYDIGYWFKTHRIGLTYGANISLRTDFDYSSIGLAPVIGYKLLQFHFQTGYHFLSRPTVAFETNTFFVSARYVFVNDRAFKRK